MLRGYLTDVVLVYLSTSYVLPLHYWKYSPFSSLSLLFLVDAISYLRFTYILSYSLLLLFCNPPEPISTLSATLTYPSALPHQHSTLLKHPSLFTQHSSALPQHLSVPLRSPWHPSTPLLYTGTPPTPPPVSFSTINTTQHPFTSLCRPSLFYHFTSTHSSPLPPLHPLSTPGCGSDMSL